MSCHVLQHNRHWNKGDAPEVIFTSSKRLESISMCIFSNGEGISDAMA